MIKGIHNRMVSVNLNSKKSPTCQENILKSPRHKITIEKTDNRLLFNKKNNVNQSTNDQSIVSKLLDQMVKNSKSKNKNIKIDHQQSNLHQQPLFQSKIDNININIAKENKLSNKFIEPIEIEVSSTMDIDIIYEIDYGNELEKCIFNNQVR